MKSQPFTRVQQENQLLLRMNDHMTLSGIAL